MLTAEPEFGFGALIGFLHDSAIADGAVGVAVLQRTHPLIIRHRGSPVTPLALRPRGPVAALQHGGRQQGAQLVQRLGVALTGAGARRRVTRGGQWLSVPGPAVCTSFSAVRG
ncbi:hypothetical protein GCM10027168_42280 [Streptomyces capparidis]